MHPEPVKRICLWSGPRNVSTALMYSFERRPDAIVIDEPLYAYYLAETGADHPGREEVMQNLSIDANKVINEVILKDYKKPVVFIKNMAHHLIRLPFDFTLKLINIFLIREPGEMLPSLIKHIPEPTMMDTGLKMQWELFQALDKKRLQPVVLDAKRLLLNPKDILIKVCKKLSIPFYDNMLYWEAGPIKEDGIWAKYWYGNVHKSTGFKSYTPKKEKVPDHLQPLLDHCTLYYNKLKTYAEH